MQTLTEIKDKHTYYQGQRDIIQAGITEKQSRVSILFDRLPSIEEAQALIQQTAKETQETLKYHVTDIVQTALDACFPGQYDFIMEFELKRGRTECRFSLEGDYNIKYNPMDSNGGGVIDIISFALRLSCWSISRTDNLIVLDEPFKFLSSNLRPLASEILKILSVKLGLQIILISHDTIMIENSDKIFEVKQNKGVSEVVVH